MNERMSEECVWDTSRSWSRWALVRWYCVPRCPPFSLPEAPMGVDLGFIVEEVNNTGKADRSTSENRFIRKIVVTKPHQGRGRAGDEVRSNDIR